VATDNELIQPVANETADRIITGLVNPYRK